MKNIYVITSTRADYGILKPLIDKLVIEKDFNVTICATGTHMDQKFGHTIDDIEIQNYRNLDKIEIDVNSKDTKSVLRTISNAISIFSNYFDNKKIDLLIVLGDRYEIFSICVAASMFKIPICHLHGGERTEGATDEFFRHCITKMSCLHFTSCQEYRQRVIQLGESPKCVFDVGALGVENILNSKFLSEKEIKEKLDVPQDKKYALLTYHPVTLENYDSVIFELNQVLEITNYFEDIYFIMTKSNADSGGEEINKGLDNYAANKSNVRCYNSLGSVNYLSAMKYCSAVIGNSSSGIIEAPAFKVPTINVGDRQKGRLQSKSIINCDAVTCQIVKKFEFSQSKEFQSIIKNCGSLYGDGHTSEKMIKEIKLFLEKDYNPKKAFYDIKL